MAATPKTYTDHVDDLDEAVLNMFVRGGKLQVKVNYCVVRFTAATNEVTVHPSNDSDGEIVDGDMTWNAGTSLVDIVLSGFSTAPVGIATIMSNASTNIEKVRVQATSGTAATLVFLSNATPGANTDPDGDVYVNLLFIGA